MVSCLSGNDEKNIKSTFVPIEVEFRLVCKEEISTCKIMKAKKTDEETYVENKVLLSLDDIASAKKEKYEPIYFPNSSKSKDGSMPTKEPIFSVSLRFDKEGGQKLYNITSSNIGRRLAVIIDGELTITPVIMDSIDSDSASINYDFTEDEANSISQRINETVKLKDG